MSTPQHATLDEYVTLIQAPLIVERITGTRPHATTVCRWRQRGIAGVRLRTIWAVGGHRTTEAWLREFFDAVTAAKNGDGTPSPISATSADAGI